VNCRFDYCRNSLIERYDNNSVNRTEIRNRQGVRNGYNHSIFVPTSAEMYTLRAEDAVIWLTVQPVGVFVVFVPSDSLLHDSNRQFVMVKTIRRSSDNGTRRLVRASGEEHRNVKPSSDRRMRRDNGTAGPFRPFYTNRASLRTIGGLWTLFVRTSYRVSFELVRSECSVSRCARARRRREPVSDRPNRLIHLISDETHRLRRRWRAHDGRGFRGRKTGKCFSPDRFATGRPTRGFHFSGTFQGGPTRPGSRRPSEENPSAGASATAVSLSSGYYRFPCPTRVPVTGHTRALSAVKRTRPVRETGVYRMYYAIPTVITNSRTVTTTIQIIMIIITIMIWRGALKDRSDNGFFTTFSLWSCPRLRQPRIATEDRRRPPHLRRSEIPSAFPDRRVHARRRDDFVLFSGVRDAKNRRTTRVLLRRRLSVYKRIHKRRFRTRAYCTADILFAGIRPD